MEVERHDFGRRVLYCKGNTSLLDVGVKLAVVGSRNMTEFGQDTVRNWMPLLVKKGVVIVSGFMYGVDQTAHEYCVDNGGKTIAVLGWGIEKKMGARDEFLYHKLIDGDSLFVSEYKGEMAATRWSFPKRNEVVVELVGTVLVVEAEMGSGSLLTARLAERYGRKLLALPGSVGTNWLIETGRAKSVTSADEVWEVMRRQNSAV